MQAPLPPSDVAERWPSPAPPSGPMPADPVQPYQRGGSLKRDRGTVILVLGILSLILLWPLGIAAWVMGNRDLADMRAGRMDPSGRQETNVGRILGMIATCWVAVAVVLGIIYSIIIGLGILAIGGALSPAAHP